MIVAVDNLAPGIEKLKQKLAQLSLTDPIRAQVGNMAELTMTQSSFDMIWSEGALYNIGTQRALSIYRGLLLKGGYLVFTDAVWCKPNPPLEIKANFESDYLTMGSVADVVALIQSSPFKLGITSLCRQEPGRMTFTPRWKRSSKNLAANMRMIQQLWKS